jgi:hypothetical protein
MDNLESRMSSLAISCKFQNFFGTFSSVDFLIYFLVLIFRRYNKLSRSDDSCEHSLEIGYVSVTNLLPNQVYKQVIFPTELNRNMPVDRQVIA